MKLGREEETRNERRIKTSKMTVEREREREQKEEREIPLLFQQQEGEADKMKP